ncbi:hypothetical protein VDG1235_808 [Verrucomicrobiia bacterium DG1235]|nr:hypothetical protein VDG1235_808 [Verrucomicrobiae bacterium DG1235]
MQQGKSNAIDLFYDSCEPDGDPSLPNAPGLQLSFRGRSNSRTIINGRLSAKTIFNYQAIPSSQGTLTIPAFRVKTSEGELTVSPARFEVVEATVGNTGISPDEVFMSLFQTRDPSIYEGEVFELEYIAGAKQDYQLADLSVPTWNPSTLVTGGLVDGQVTGVNYDGSQYVVKVYTAKAMATQSGFLEVEGARQEATVVIGRRRDFLFQEPVYDAFTIESDPFSVEVLPLPNGAPASFRGAVGSFALESRVVPEEVQIGEPITWTLELSGSGNWPAGIGVPPRSVSSRFKAIQPEIKNEFEDDDLFTGRQTEDIVLIPTEVGSFEFGPVQYTYFDPVSESYKTIEIPAKTVTIVPAAPTNPSLSSALEGDAPEIVSGSGPANQETYTLDPNGQNVFLKPPELLKDPLSGASSFAIPTIAKTIYKPTLVALACPLAFWFLLAFAKGFANDPRKSERKALSELRKISRSKFPDDPEARKKLHLKWRDAAARYFALSAIEPTPDEVATAALQLRGEEFAANWRNAWQLSDQALFGVADYDHEEWLRLQRLACSACPSKSFNPSQVFKYKSWVPTFAILALLTLAVQNLSAQSESAEVNSLYNQGKFKAASAKWVEAINESPEVFEYRYNAGLAAAQLGDWSRAWGLWTGSFCLDPSNEEVAWNLRIAHQNTSAYDPVLQSLLESEGLYALVKLRSPAAWQSLSVHSLWALGALLSLSILALYLRPARKLASPLFILGLLAGVLAYFSIWAHMKYEALGDPNTLLVIQESALLSIPTDLQPDQVSSSVSEGSVARFEKSFLGWMKISLPNGESGWVRRESLLPLYGELTQI